MTSDILKRNNVNVSGTGDTPMLFAHGFGCEQTMWRHVAPAFERDHRVIKYDLTGAGRSDLSAYTTDRYGTLDGHADDILQICDALELQDVILVGHSVSSITGVLAANREPGRFAKLVLVAPSPCFIDDGDYKGGFAREDLEGLIAFMDENYLGWVNQLMPSISGQPTEASSTTELTQSFCRTDPEIAKHFGRVTFLSDRRADMEKLTIPSLILQCSDDALAPVAVGEWLHAQMSGATLTVLPVTGHCPHLSDPDKTIKAIRDYLGSA